MLCGVGGAVCGTVGVGVGDAVGEGVSGASVGVGVAVAVGVGPPTLTTGRGHAEAPTAPRTTPITNAARTPATAFLVEITQQA